MGLVVTLIGIIIVLLFNAGAHEKEKKMEKTLEQLKDDLIDVEARQFVLAMKDGWTPEDFKYDDELTKEANRLRAEIEKLGGKHA